MIIQLIVVLEDGASKLLPKLPDMVRVMLILRNRGSVGAGNVPRPRSARGRGEAPPPREPREDETSERQRAAPLFFPGLFRLRSELSTATLSAASRPHRVSGVALHADHLV
jgi:hypothetical protein